MRTTSFHSGVPAASFSDLVDKYGTAEFDSPFRSTVALLSYWRQPDARLPAFASVLEVPLGDAAELHFEYQVPVQRGRGKPSCTDLMILSGATSMAVEAKSTEPRYQTVESWLSRETDRNRSDVLDGWLRLLNRVAHAPIARKKVEGLPYQLIHRAASACQPDVADRWLIYHVYSSSPDAATKYKADLEQLRTVLGSSPLQVRLLWSELQPSAGCSELFNRWDKGERHLSAGVKQGLKAHDLFACGRLELIPID
jgi:hypothetical protein